MQEFYYKTPMRPHPNGGSLRATVRFDNECGNAEQHFSITAELFRDIGVIDACGCLHDDVRLVFPELAPFIKWHLCSPSGPMHYVANGIYWHQLWGNLIAGPPWSDDEYAQGYGVKKLRAFFCNTIVFTEGEADLDELVAYSIDELHEWLTARQPRLRQEFAQAMEAARVLFPE